jgi:branched-chain amino acid aminotransferase/4-amino-4-deoxychorismate lyase
MSIDAHDRGLLLGDGLFETLLWTRGGLVLFEAHAARMARGCAVLGLPAPEAAELEAAAKGAMAAAGLTEARAAVRLTWTAGSGGRGLDRPEQVSPRLIATAAAAPERRTPARLATSTVRRNDGSPASRLKTLAYLDNVLARREARAQGGDEALMLNCRGELACAAVANLFWVEGGVLVTPALDCGVLDGVMRGEVLRAAAALGLQTREARAGREALDRAEGLFLTNSLIGVCEVETLDGAAVSRSEVPGRLREALAEVV